MESIEKEPKNTEPDISTSNDSPLPSTQRCESGRKRKLSSGPDTVAVQPDAKFQLIEAVCDALENLSEDNVSANLLDLSDEILLLIFQHLDSNSLLALSTACIRLQRLVVDKTLWAEADFTTVTLKTCEVHRRMKYLQPATKSLKLRGMTSIYPAEQWKVPTMSLAILKTIDTRCPLLERLELTEAYLNKNEISITMFPKTLRSLVFRNCALSSQNVHDNIMLPNHQIISFLSNIYKHLVNLEELRIEYCGWFDIHDFMVVSKLPGLRYLSLRGCANVKDSVPYASLATRFGFKKLEVLDLRDTPVSDSDVSCFSIVYSLKELKLDCPAHLRTERGLMEYYESERLRVAQLHRLAAPELQVNEGGNRPSNPAGNPARADDPVRVIRGPPPPIPPPRHGIVEVRVVEANFPRRRFGQRHHANLIRIYQPRGDVQANVQLPVPPVPDAPRVEGPAAEDLPQPQQPPAVDPVAVQQAAGAGINNNANNNIFDRQQIVRIINRDMVLQRIGHIGIGPPPLLQRPAERVQMNVNVAYQRLFNFDGNPVQRPRAPEPVAQGPDEGNRGFAALARPAGQLDDDAQLLPNGDPNLAQNHNLNPHNGQLEQQQQPEDQQEPNPHVLANDNPNLDHNYNLNQPNSPPVQQPEPERQPQGNPPIIDDDLAQGNDLIQPDGQPVQQPEPEREPQANPQILDDDNPDLVQHDDLHQPNDHPVQQPEPEMQQQDDVRNLDNDNPDVAQNNDLNQPNGQPEQQPQPPEGQPVNPQMFDNGFAQNNGHPAQQPQPQRQQQQANFQANRILPHVIIMPGHFPENFQGFVHRAANGNHLYVNLGIGQPARNYVSLVSDRSICGYGMSQNEQRRGVQMGGLLRYATSLERLYVRNYKLVTDTSLEHLESAAPHLKLLDVTGTSVTAEGVRNFKLSRTGCVILSDYDKEKEPTEQQ